MNTHAAPLLRCRRGRRSARCCHRMRAPRCCRSRPRRLDLSLPASFSPCCVQVEPERVNTHAAPRALVVVGCRRPERCCHPRTAPRCRQSRPYEPSRSLQLPVSSSPCWLQVEPERVNTHAAPAQLLSRRHRRSARCCHRRRAPRCRRSLAALAAPVSFSPCWVQVEPERVNTHAAPMPPSSPRAADQRGVAIGGERHADAETPPPFLSAAGELFALLGPGRARAREHPRRPDFASIGAAVGPPISAVLPSADSATLSPNSPSPVSPRPVSFSPCWMNGSIRSG